MCNGTVAQFSAGGLEGIGKRRRDLKHAREEEKERHWQSFTGPQ